MAIAGATVSRCSPFNSDWLNHIKQQLGNTTHPDYSLGEGKNLEYTFGELLLMKKIISNFRHVLGFQVVGLSCMIIVLSGLKFKIFAQIKANI